MRTITTEFTPPDPDLRRKLVLTLCKRRLLIWGSVAVVGIIIFVVALAAGLKQLIVLGLGLAGGGLADVIAVRISANKFANAKDEIHAGGGRVVADDEAVTLESEIGFTQRLPWSLLQKVEGEGAEYFLWFGKNSLILLNSKGYSPEDWTELSQKVEALRKGLPAK